MCPTAPSPALPHPRALQVNGAACVLNDALLLGLLRSNYPAVTLVVMDGTAGTLMDAVNAGACVGAIMPNFQADYVLGPGDPNGLYCSASVVSTNINFNYLALPFNRRTVGANVRALRSCALCPVFWLPES